MRVCLRLPAYSASAKVICFIIERLGDWCPVILPNQEVFFRISLTKRGPEAALTLSIGTAFVAAGGVAEYNLPRIARLLHRQARARLGAAIITPEQGFALSQSQAIELSDILTNIESVTRANYDELTRAYRTIDAQQRQITQLQARVTGGPPPDIATNIRRLPV